jgi:hypothetical protein
MRRARVPSIQFEIHWHTTTMVVWQKNGGKRMATTKQRLLGMVLLIL